MILVIDNQMLQSAYHRVFVKLFVKQMLQSMYPRVSSTGGIFQVVSFTDTARVLIDSTTMDNPNPQTVLTAVDGIQAASSTAQSDPTPALATTQTLIQESRFDNGTSPYHASVMIASNSQQPAPQPAIELSTSIISEGADLFGVALGGETVSPMLLTLSKQPSTQFMMAVSEATQVNSAAASVSAALFPGKFPAWDSRVVVSFILHCVRLQQFMLWFANLL